MSKTIEECHNELIALKGIPGNTYHFSFFSETLDKGSYSLNKDDSAFGITGPYGLDDRNGDVWITLKNAKGSTEDNEPTLDNIVKVNTDNLNRTIQLANMGEKSLSMPFEDFLYLRQHDRFHLEALY